MYRQIAANALAEGDTLHKTLLRERQEAEAVADAARREISALKFQLFKAATTPVTPATTRLRSLCFEILPQTPKVLSSLLGLEPLSNGDSDDSSSNRLPRRSPYTPVTPLATRVTNYTQRSRSAKFLDPLMLKDVGRLEKTYGDPYKKLNARRDFQKLYLKDPADFATFQGDFFRLAQERCLPADQWVEEFHEKLPDALRTQMGIYRRQYSEQYDEYVDCAQEFARELAISANKASSTVKTQRSRRRNR
ncbi:hypothetical protein CC78DRAFT_600460 [Lojkania enalia]|uniref:Uncharacterized protein n=1 Tax=Lojkania enalia TaxID=147567 RepID=A0A9P4KBQ2_9PLEO|nr:hypothetical protein CC78DRAFT_600460 [Didymosphaeria enalia]